MGKIEEPQMSEEELRNLLEYSECATFVLEQGMEFKVVYANPKFYQILRYTKEEFADRKAVCSRWPYPFGISYQTQRWCSSFFVDDSKSIRSK